MKSKNDSIFNSLDIRRTNADGAMPGAQIFYNKGLPEAITSIFPHPVTQICVVHQIRNASRYVVWKDKKQFAADIKTVYTAQVRIWLGKLENLKNKWGKKYPLAIRS